MVFSRKHVSVIALLLIVLLSLTWNLKIVSASSGGVMGGSFFKSDSSSSSKSFTSQSYSSSFSKSFTSQSYSQRVKEQNHVHDEAPSRDGDEVASGDLHPIISFLLIATGCVLVRYFYKEKENNENTLTVTVLKLQVGMLNEMGCTIQRDLNRIAETYNTSSKEGVSCLLKETIQTLDQHHGYCKAVYSSVDLKRSEEDGEKCYNQLSIEEREKFDGETLVNLNNNNKTRIRSQSYDRSSDEYSKSDVKKSCEETEKFEKEKLLSGFNKYVVVTILVATKGTNELPNMNGAEDLKEALQKLKSLLSSKHLLAGEVLWTPQKEDDSLSDGKLLKDYPQLAKSMK